MRVDLASDLLATSEGQRAEEILRRCVHCGFCNATCPTYNLLGDELDGPRGRIYLIKGMFESNEVNADAHNHLSRCLTCRNCETTCPSGVEYGELLELGREFINTKDSRTTFLERMLLRVVPHYRRLRAIVRLGLLVRWFLPPSTKRKLPPLKSGKLKGDGDDAKVTLLQGCAQRALTPEVNQHLAQLLRDRDVSFNVETRETCCGGLHLHLGHHEEAKRRMQSYVKTLYSPATESYLSTAAGCGVTIKDYGRYLDDDEGQELATKTFDISEYLSQFEFKRHPNIQRVALHLPCTLQHGQRLVGSIESILRRTGYDLVPVRDSHLCCGSAGTYSILQPELATELLDRKVESLEAHSPDVIATANVGCQLHLASGSELRVVHWLMLLR